MPKLASNPTIDKAAQAWTRGFASAVRAAAGDSGRLTPAKAEGMTGPYADNAKNYFDRTGKSWAKADTLIESGARYVRAQAAEVAGSDGRLSLKDIRRLPADLVDDVLILRGKLSPPAAAPAGLQALKDAVKGTEIGALNDYGKHLGVSTYSAGKSREDVLRDVAGYDDLSDREVNDWFASVKGGRAVADFAAAMQDVGADERENAVNDAKGADIERRLVAVGTAAQALFKVADFKSLELVEHFIEEDGDIEHRILLARQKDDSWLVLSYADFPF